MAPRSKRVPHELPNYTVYFDPPHWFVGFLIVLAVRVLSAVATSISDCDEVYNYWEPTHYLMFKKGLQTWEYSPKYGIRSYSYVLLYTLLGKALQLYFTDKFVIFYMMRSLLAFFVVIAEFYFIKGVEIVYGAEASFFAFFFQLVSAGNFLHSVSLLPSSFAIIWVLVTLGAWMRESYMVATFASTISILVGWPFSGLVYLPFMIHSVMKKGLWSMMWRYFFAGIVVSSYVILVDLIYFKKFMFAPLNIVLYNVFGGAEVGPHLYGTEPWYYYIFGLLINHNGSIVLAVLVPVIILVLETWYFNKKATIMSLWHLSGMYLWVTFMSFQPHKEERFMFLVYPFISLGASIALSFVIKSSLITRNSNAHQKGLIKYKIASMVIVAMMMVLTAVHSSRMAANIDNYKAPMKLWQTLKMEMKPLPVNEEVNVCLGKEWYHFPSSFFLPHPKHNLKFIKSGFDGLLPKYYMEWPQGLYEEPTTMNDRNIEEFDRYSNLSSCDYLVERYFPDQVEENYLKTLDIGDEGAHEWSFLARGTFVNRERSPPVLRSFLVPEYSRKMNVLDDYYVLKRNRKSSAKAFAE